MAHSTVIERRVKRCDELFEMVNQLTEEQSHSVLCYLCGYCAKDKRFVEGLAAALSHETIPSERTTERK